MSMIKEFKDFAMRGNVVDLAVGVIIGAAFGKIVDSLVKDVITGVFIQFENGMNTGEYVTVSGITGTVERMTLRITQLRDPEGRAHFVPNGSIVRVVVLRDSPTNTTVRVYTRRKSAVFLK